ncbi:MAG: cupin domain-containing protein [Candidatus Omnitrophota bacterium]
MLNNIFKNLPDASHNEIFDDLLTRPGMKVERIVSQGQATPDGDWLVSDWDEWVLLLKGKAGLLFEGAPNPVLLTEGDYLLIPSGMNHRVEWTDSDGQTVWLAIHFNG